MRVRDHQKPEISLSPVGLVHFCFKKQKMLSHFAEDLSSRKIGQTGPEGFGACSNKPIGQTVVFFFT